MTEQQRKVIKGRVILALHEVLNRKPTHEEIERYFRAAQVLYSALRPDLYADKTANQSSANHEPTGNFCCTSSMNSGFVRSLRCTSPPTFEYVSLFALERTH